MLKVKMIDFFLALGVYVCPLENWHNFLKHNLHLDPDAAVLPLSMCPLIARTKSLQLCPQTLTWAQPKSHKQESKLVNRDLVTENSASTANNQ